MTKTSRNQFLTVRLTPQERNAFSRKAESYGGPTYVIRELIEAFVQDRLIVTPNPEKRSLYHVPRNQD